MVETKKAKSGGLAKNTAFLYMLSLSSQIVNVALIPFETRTLGSAAYGVIALAVSMSAIMTIILDFGFILSATEIAVRHRDNPDSLSHLSGNVLFDKGILSSIMMVVILTLTFLIEPFKSNRSLFILYCLAYIANALLPDFLYRGLEDMKAIAIRSVVVKVGFSLPIFFLLHSARDMWVIPLCLLMGNGLAALYSYTDLAKRYGIRINSPSIAEALGLLRKSAPFFISRSASTFYQSMNAVMLGVLYPGGSIVGQYGATEKFLSYTKTLSSPVADSLYPYMVRTKNYRLAIRVLKITVPFICVGSALAWVYATPLCTFVFGGGYEGSAVLLRCLMPAIMVIFPTYILCFPMLVPMGLSDYANRSNVVGAVVQVVSICILLVVGRLNAVTICMAASLSEVSVFAFRFWGVWSHRDLMLGVEAGEGTR